MSLLYTIAVILFVVGLIGLVIPGIPGATFIRWAILIAVFLFIIGLITGRSA